MTYLITFACYGCHLHGDESGSVDREHNLHGSRLVAGDPRRASAERAQMDQSPYTMDSRRREALPQLSRFAAHVRSSHVHIAVESEARPKRIMNDLKILREPLSEPDWAGSTCSRVARQHPVCRRGEASLA